MWSYLRPLTNDLGGGDHGKVFGLCMTYRSFVCRQIHGAKTARSVAGVEDLTAQSCGAGRGSRSARSADDPIQGAICPPHPASGKAYALLVSVTPNPTAERVAQQITEAFPWDQAPHYLIRDG